MGLYQIFKKQGGWNLISQWVKAGVFPYAIAQIAISGFSRKSLARLVKSSPCCISEIPLEGNIYLNEAVL